MNPRQKRINTALAAVLLAQGLPNEVVCAKVGAKNWNSLRSSLNAKGVTITACRSMPGSNPQAMTANSPQVQKLVTLASEALKERIGGTAQSLADKLALAHVGGKVRDIAAAANVLEPLSRVGDRLYGWSASAGPTWNVTVLDLNPVSCVSDTPSGSMPEQKQFESGQLVSEVIDVQSEVKPT